MMSNYRDVYAIYKIISGFTSIATKKNIIRYGSFI